MSKDIKQVYDTNPQTINESNDLMYFGRSPYDVTDDIAIQYSDFVKTLGGNYNYRYVSSTDGVDAVGNGSILKPYATIGYALSQITDNTTSKRYMVNCYGVFTETTLSLKPWVGLLGNGSKLTATTINLSDTNVDNSLIWMSDFVEVPATITLNFTNIDCYLYLSNIQPSAIVVWTIIASSEKSVFGIIQNCLSTTGDFIDLFIENYSGFVSNNSVGNSFITHSAHAANHFLNYKNNNITNGGTYEFRNYANTFMRVNIDDTCNADCTLNVITTDSGTLTVHVVNASEFTAINISGPNAFFEADLLSVVPSFVEGAIDGVNALYPSLASSITAGFSPTNYTADNPRVQAHLQGIDAQLGVISPATNSFIYRYVSSTNGVDAVGNGSSLKPYATISYALSQITDASSSKLYFLNCYGVFTETNLAIKQFIFLQGNNSNLTITNPITLDGGFSSGGILSIEGFGNFNADISTDFSALSSASIFINDNKIGSNTNWNISGPTAGLFVGSINNNIKSSTTIVNNLLTINNFSGDINNNDFSVVDLSQISSSGTNCEINFLNNAETGSLSISAAQNKNLTVYSNSFTKNSSLTISGADTGIAKLNCIGGSKFSSVSLAGTNALLIVDLLSVTPIFSSGATDAANITYGSLASSVTAGFSPINYTVSNARVQAHLEGIDTKLADLGTPTNLILTNATGDQLGDITGSNAATLHVREYIDASVPQGSAISLTSTVANNVLSIFLTAGDWEVRGIVYFLSGAATVTTKILSAISGNSATVPTLAAENNVSFLELPFTTGKSQSLGVGTRRVSINVSTVIFLVAQATFTVDTLSAFGYMGARRV